MPSTVVGRGFSHEEDNTLSEITSSLLSSLMVSSKVLFVFLNWFYYHFDAISIFQFVSVILLEVQQLNLFLRRILIFFLHFSLQFLVDILTKESIIWKLKILKTAASFVNSRLHAVKAQTLVLAR